MYEQEKRRETHLIILIVYTVLTLALVVESYLMGWEPGAVVLLLVGLAACWFLHITEKVLASVRLWLYFVMTMLTFFFYGIHETSIFDLAPLMVIIIVLYSITEKYNIIRLCVLTYILTICYDFVFVLGGSVEITTLSVTRLLFHILIVCMSAQIVKILLQRQKKERKIADARIGELKEINLRTEDFMTNVSHELRTPINAVTGMTSVMLKNEEDPLKRRDISAIQMAGFKLFNQIEDILDYTEIDTGRIRLSEENYTILSIVNDIMTESQEFMKENMPELIFDIDANIPAILFGDGKKIKKILRHLIDNALKFTKRGGVYVRIYALHKPYGINLCMQVRDTGIGIAKEELGRIKERFYQANGGRNRRAGGLGLGLSIVYGMVQTMQGFIHVESTLGKGTAVCVSVPQKVVEETPCMAVERHKNLCLACYLMTAKYAVPEVRDFYDKVISHMVHELDIPLHRVSNLDELENLASMNQLTHLFIGKEEYQENRLYFEEKGRDTKVILVADDSFRLSKDSRVRILRKPFCSFAIINVLNATTLKEVNTTQKMQMVCPDVKALVVDDEPMNLLVAEGILKGYQMDVKTADSGKMALRICEKSDFDLVFLDHMMPEMDGVETLRRLRKIKADSDRQLTVIAFTANAVSGAREMFLKEGFDEFISKPIEIAELERILKKVLPKSAYTYVEENEEIKEREYSKEQSFGGVNNQGENSPGENSPKDWMSDLEHFGMHTKAGLDYSQGDQSFYLKLLVKFADGYAAKETELNDCFQREDWDNYRIQVHALKSSSRLIGADSLSSMAKETEEAAKRHDTDYIRAHHEALLMQYRETAYYISGVLGSDENEQEESRTEISREELLQYLHELAESLHSYEMDRAEALIMELNGCECKEVVCKKLLQDVNSDVEDFEFDKAFEKLKDILEDLEGGITDESEETDSGNQRS